MNFYAFLGCSPYVDIMVVIDASESMIQNDPYGKILYNWDRVSV